MTFQEFDELMNSVMKRLYEISATKGKEYANNQEDRLANFKRCAVKYGVGADVVVGIYLDKHMDSIAHHIKTGEAYSEDPRGRIEDAIMYLHLLLAVWQDMGKTDSLKKKEESTLKTLDTFLDRYKNTEAK